MKYLAVIAILIVTGAVAFYSVGTTEAQESVCAGTPSMPADASDQLLADCDALINSKSAIKGTGSLNWWTGKDITNWNGITVSGGRVTGLDLRDRNLDGTIPARIADLDALQYLYLSGNAFTGCVPAALASVPNNDVAAAGLSFCGGAQSPTPTPQPTVPPGTPVTGTPISPPPPTDSALQSRVAVLETAVANVKSRVANTETRLDTAEADIEQLRATVTPVPVPDGKPIVLTGTGGTTERIELQAGVWSVGLSITGNETCGRICSSDFFDVDIDSVTSTKDESLAFEYAKEWTGAAALHVGHHFSDDLSPGRQIVTINATGTWEITFLKEG